ncbi:gamma-glutamyl hydrolase-like isoform X2 [Branchiostoma lanceolatum]|uniref:gamma-glutamyl hydrolase-like isoform X2 n=1 Tax=Branchiostoma lanceolatum TaxID=7740 RepID=UPI003453BF79
MVDVLIRYNLLVMANLAVLSLVVVAVGTVQGFSVRDAPEVNDRPIIGVIAQASGETRAKYGKTYIPASYVKYLESAGARVVPIRVNLTVAEYTKLFNSLNGVLYPGGAVDMFTSGYAKSAKIFYDLALKAFDQGDHFPVWGTCMGFEQLTALTSGRNVLTTCKGTGNKSYKLDFAPDYKFSRMFGKVPVDILTDLATLPLTANFHEYCLTPKNFTNDAKLSSFYKILSTNTDDDGMEFVSSMEAIKYPVYGVQWHPEKNNFEFGSILKITHSDAATKVSQAMANFLVSEARKSTHRFPTHAEEVEALIYNYSPVYTGNVTISDQTYFFD